MSPFVPLATFPVTPMPPPTKTIRLRTNEIVLDVIDRAAAAVCKTRSEFILEASATAAQNALLDQTYFALSPSQIAEFQRVMEVPLACNAGLRALLSAPAPWEQPDPPLD